MILLDGELQTRQYIDKNNVQRDIVEIIVDHASFTGEPKAQQQGSGGYQNNYSSYQNNQQGGGYQSGYSQSQPVPVTAVPAPALSQGDAQDFVDNASSDDDYPF
jgi:single-stranded DNA-binding protein